MKITGIIAEYNPFHNGHQYHLECAREKTGADYVIAVMSGDFTQRGYPAIADKHMRARMALSCGADLVLELPVCYAAGSAEYFAGGAVALLDALGVVDTLFFGSELGSIPPLMTIAERLIQGDSAQTIHQMIGTRLRMGHSYPKARSLTYGRLFPDSAAQTLLSSPNNLLGIEYLKALLLLSSSIRPLTMKRSGAAYHDTDLSERNANDRGVRSSASAIRRSLSEKGSPEELSAHVPEAVFRLLTARYQKSFPLYADDFSLLLHYKLLTEAQNGYTDYLDVTPDLSDKIAKNLNAFMTFPQFCTLLKSKDLTHSRISRSLLHILLDLKKGQVPQSGRCAPIHYARILGFRKEAEPLLHAVKAHASVPLLSKLSTASSLLNKDGNELLNKDIASAHIYSAAASAKFHTPFVNEYQKQIVILP